MILAFAVFAGTLVVAPLVGRWRAKAWLRENGFAGVGGTLGQAAGVGLA